MRSKYDFNPKRLFVTGTDTDIGKTVTTVALMQALKLEGHQVAGFKPVAAGGITREAASELSVAGESDVAGELGAAGEVGNEDALLIQRQSSYKQSYESVNPVFFSEAVAPHIAAVNQGVSLTAAACADKVSQQIESLNLPASGAFSVIEGAGGWRVPLNNKEYFSDLAVRLNVGVILVVGIRLGCLNHAALTAEAIERDGLPLLGWVANCCDPDALYIEENILTLKASIEAPMVARIPHLSALSDLMSAPGDLMSAPGDLTSGEPSESLGSYIDVKQLKGRISRCS